MKNMLFAGSSVADIVRAVSDERSRTGKRFNQDTVTKLLKRVQNGGTYRYAGVEVEGGMPGLWSQSEQDMILSILELSITKKNSSRDDAGECTVQISGRWFAIVGLVGKNL